jgi:hypothetical protein
VAELKEYLYQIVAWIARIHDSMWEYNRSFSSPFTDKELHFIVIGAFGLVLFALSFLLFKLLTRLNRSGVMAWLFSFSVVLFVTFAIEIGQFVTSTGNMELEDIVYGIVGFFAASVGAALLYGLFCLLRALIRQLDKIL